jgi:glycerol-3-phosphate dehydrogenase (NAD(P)+)
MIRAALIGNGERLLALELLLREAGTALVRPAAGETAAELDAELLFIDVPPAELRGVLEALRPGPQDFVVLSSRGLDTTTGRRLSEIVEEHTACLRIGALAGPLLYTEIQRRAPSAVLVASPYDAVSRAVHTALRSPVCQVYRSNDLTGAELSGALVEVLCAALGAARGLGAGVGLQALAVSRGIAEGGALFQRVGGNPRTFAGLAGVGELVAAASVQDHPSLRRGLALARGERDAALVSLCDALLRRERDLPITRAVREVASGAGLAEQVLRELLEQDPGAEF